MKKLHFTKKTISNMENLKQLSGGAADVNHTYYCDTEEICTYSEVPTCPLTTSRTSEGRTRKGSK